MTEWPFRDPENVAVFTCKQITSGEKKICLVTHDSVDGVWQFHTNDPVPLNIEDAVIVSLREMFTLDPTIQEVSDLPLGWKAWRQSPLHTWQRAEDKSQQ